MGADVVSINAGATGIFVSANVGAGISVTSNYSLTGANAGNYTVSQPALTANITAIVLTITGETANNKVYDGTTTATLGGVPVLSAGVLPADVATVTLNSGGATGTFASTGPGVAIAVTTSGYSLNGGAAALNYNLTQPTTSATIFAAEPTGQTKNIAFASVTAVSMTINFQLPSSGAGSNRLVLVNEGAVVSATPADFTSYTASTDWSTKGSQIGVGNYVVYGGVGTSVSLTNLNVNTTYNVQIFEFNGTPGTSLENYYLGVGSNNPKAKATNNVDANSTFSGGTGAGTIPSIATTQPSEVIVFQFDATDLGTSDGVSTRFTQLIFRPGAGNAVADWTQLFGTTGHAELYDNAAHGPSQHGTAIITANTITIPSISAGSPPDLGSISDNSARTYYLKVWLLTSLGGSLPANVDNQNVAFSITGSDVTPVATKSVFAPATTTSSGADQITVTATKIKINQQPSTAVFANVPLPTQPIFEATDVNNNRDDINNAITVTTTNPTNLGPTSALANFSNGLADFIGSGFKFLNIGSSTMAVSITSPTLTSPNTSAITVSASTNLGNSVTAMSPSPLTNSTVGVISSGSATNAVLGFNLQTTGSPLTLSQVVFNSSVSVTGLVQNFTLYSNSSDSFTGATAVTTSSTLTFSGLSVPLTAAKTFFFLVCDVYPSFPTLNPTIQFSLPAGNFTVSSGSKTGSTQTGTNYLLQDLTPPVLQTISTMPAFLNSWATVWPYHTTTPAYNGNFANFLMTFSEPVQGMTTAKLAPQVFNLTSFSLLSVSPTDNVGNPTSSPSQYWRISYSITGSNNSGTVNGGHIYSQYANSAPFVTDVALNQETTVTSSRFIPSPPGSDFYYVTLPRPTNPVASFNVASITTTSIMVNWTQPPAPLGQIPTHYLVRAKESALGSFLSAITNGQLIPNDPNASDGYVAVNIANTGYPALTPAILSTTFNLKSGVSYDFEIYAYSRGSYPNVDLEIDYNPTAATLTTSTTVAASALLNLSAAAPTISSLTTTQVAAHAQATPNLQFQINDELADQDNAPTKFSGLIVKQGAGNAIANWTQAIAGAELTDGTTVLNAFSITATQIIFTGIASTNPGDLGYVPDAIPSNPTPKTYSLNVWLKSPLVGNLDDFHLSFLVDNLSFTLDNTSSGQLSTTFQASQAVSGGAANKIDVQATQLLFTTNLPDKVGLKHTFSSAPVVEARDANNNLDIDFIGATISASNGITFSNLPAWISGKLTFSTFVFNDPGLTQITVAKAGVTSAVSNSPTGPGGQTDVKISAYTSVNQTGSPASTISSVTTLVPAAVPAGGQLNAAATSLSFIVKDDDTVPAVEDDVLPTRINTITIKQNVNNGTPVGGANFDNWQNSIASAELSVGGVNVGGTVAINTNSIVFSGIPNGVAANLGFIADNGSRTYVLKIWFKNSITPAALQDTFDGEDFVFEITNASDFSLTSVVGNYSSTLNTLSAFNSGDGFNKVDVLATQLDFLTIWNPATPAVPTQSYDATIAPAPSAKARDANQNLAKNYTNNTTLVLNSSNNVTYPLLNAAVTATAGIVSFTAGLKVASSGNGANGASTALSLTDGTIAGPASASFILGYSGASDIIKNTFTYSTDIQTINFREAVNLTTANSVAIEEFILRDGGASNDADGTKTKLNSISLNIQNHSTIRRIGIYDGATEIKELDSTFFAANGDITFSSFSTIFEANDDDHTNKILTVRVSFNALSIADNVQLNVRVIGATVTGVSSQLISGTTGYATLGTYDNRLEIVATKIIFATIDATASISVPVNAIANAIDAYGNLDADYNGTISAASNTNPGNFNTINNPSGAFIGGVKPYPALFQFDIGNGLVKLTLNSGAGSGANNVNAGAIAGTSPTISVLSSFDSWVYFDPTFAYTDQIDFVPFQSGVTSNTSQAIGRLILSDGGAPGSTVSINNPSPGTKNLSLGSHNDIDGATTKITDVTISLGNNADIKAIGLYTISGVLISEVSTPGTSVTFTGLSAYPAPDDDAIAYVIRAEFKSSIVDQHQITMQITAVTHNSGSKFPTNGTIAGIAGGDAPSAGHNFLDVIATSLDFTTPSSNFVGTYEPIGKTPPQSGTPYVSSPLISTNAAVVSARDIYANIDTGFTPIASSITITDNVGELISSPRGFNSGQLMLDGLKYTIAGDGKLRVQANGLDSSNPPVANTLAITGNAVNVVNVIATLPGFPVIQGLGSPPSYSIKGGSTGQVIFGVTFTAQGATPSEPLLKKFSFSFDKPYKTVAGAVITQIFKTFVVREGLTDITGSPINGTLTYSESVPLSGNFDIITVDMSSNPRSLTSGALSYFLLADVDASANIGTPSLTPQFIDGIYGSGNDGNIQVSAGTASGTFNGNIYTFASTRPPKLLSSKNSLTNPFNGQLNVNASLGHIDLEFDVAVGSLDGGLNNGAELFNRTTNTKVADLIVKYNPLNNPVVPGNYLSTGDYKNVVNPLSYDIKFLPGLSFKPDSIYYVNIKKGSFNPLATPKPTGDGISDQGLNFYGGISSSSELYFKISSILPLKLNAATSSFHNTSIGTLDTKFDQLGTAYFLIVPFGSVAPDSSEVKNPAAYSLAHPAVIVAAKGNYVIKQVNVLQSHTFKAAFAASQKYDVYVFAENDRLPTPISSKGIYGSTLVANSGGPTLQFTMATSPPLNNSPAYLICPNSNVIVSEPIIIGEASVSQWKSATLQDFNILLPTGYEFDLSSPISYPTVQLIGADFSGAIPSLTFISNTVLNISYTNNPLVSASTDFIIISGLKLKGVSGSLVGSIQRFFGINTFSSPIVSLGSVGLFPTNTFTFNNSYSKDNTFPAPTPIIVNSIPDNYIDIDTKINGSIRLLPKITVTNDYNSSTFTGNGVTNDLLSLSGVATNTAFDITMLHTDPNGCISQKSEQYLVYDHKSPISTKLGTSNSTINPAGTAQALVNPKFPLNSDPILPTVSILHNELASYELINLSADLPVSEKILNLKSQNSQIISGTAWQNQVKKIIPTLHPITLVANPTQIIIPVLGTYSNYIWDYAHILNAFAENPSVGLNPIDNFIKSTAIKNTYWVGGSLGKVEFTGVYRSTADLSVVVPFKQEVELFVPAIPIIEIGSSNQSSFDPIDGTVNTLNSQTAFNYIKNTFGFQYTNPKGFEGTPIFCEAGGSITINGYPLAVAGTSTGTFAIFDYSAYDLSKLPIANTQLTPLLGFVDNGNGTATIDPTKIKNSYKDIIVTYTYQENNSPATGVGFLILRVSPNPVPDFTTSLLCEDINVQFTDISSIQTASGVTINRWDWNFSDNNSPANSASVKNPVHKYDDAGLFPSVSLRVLTNYNCASVSPKQKDLNIGGTPRVAFGLRGVSIADTLSFTSTSSSSANDNLAKLDWQFGNGISLPISSAFNLPVSNIYAIPGSYNVDLKVTTQIGCTNSLIKQIVVLDHYTPTPSNAYEEKFESSSGNWQVAKASNSPTSSSWEYGTPTTSIIKVDPKITGSKVWKTGLNGTYNPKEISAIYSPSFDLKKLDRPMISFNSFTQIDNSDGVVLQYSIDNKNVTDPTKVWEVLGQLNDGVGWFTDQGIAAKPGNQSVKDYGWSGVNKATWIESKHIIDGQGKPLVKERKVVFRFALASAKDLPAFEGFAFDNVRVGERTRTILLESFTNSGNSNPDEKTDNDAIKLFNVGSVGTEVVKFMYHIGFPQNDPFNLDNPADPSSRALYYNIAKTPASRLDGFSGSNSTQQLFSQWGNAEFSQRTLQLAQADIKINPIGAFFNSNGKISFTIDITPVVTLSNKTVLHVGILEGTVPLASLGARQSMVKTGETTFEYVVKTMLPNALGTKTSTNVKATTSGDLIPGATATTYTFGPFEWIPGGLYSPTTADLAVGVFLQNIDTKEIYQSEITPLFDDPTNVITAVEPITSENINLYPNPANKEFIIEIPRKLKSDATVRLIDQLGQSVDAGILPAGRNSITVSTQDLASTVYIVEIRAGDEFLVRKKVVVVH